MDAATTRGMLSLPSHGVSHDGIGARVEEALWQAHAHSSRQHLAPEAVTGVVAGRLICYKVS